MLSKEKTNLTPRDAFVDVDNISSSPDQMLHCFPASIGRTYENVHCVTKNSAYPPNPDIIEEKIIR